MMDINSQPQQVAPSSGDMMDINSQPQQLAPSSGDMIDISEFPPTKSVNAPSSGDMIDISEFPPTKSVNGLYTPTLHIGVSILNKYISTMVNEDGTTRVTKEFTELALVMLHELTKVSMKKILVCPFIVNLRRDDDEGPFGTRGEWNDNKKRMLQENKNVWVCSSNNEDVDVIIIFEINQNHEIELFTTVEGESEVNELVDLVGGKMSQWIDPRYRVKDGAIAKAKCKRRPSQFHSLGNKFVHVNNSSDIIRKVNEAVCMANVVSGSVLDSVCVVDSVLTIMHLVISKYDGVHKFYYEWICKWVKRMCELPARNKKLMLLVDDGTCIEFDSASSSPPSFNLESEYIVVGNNDRVHSEVLQGPLPSQFYSGGTDAGQFGGGISMDDEKGGQPPPVKTRVFRPVDVPNGMRIMEKGQKHAAAVPPEVVQISNTTASGLTSVTESTSVTASYRYTDVTKVMTLTAASNTSLSDSQNNSHDLGGGAGVVDGGDAAGNVEFFETSQSDSVSTDAAKPMQFAQTFSPSQETSASISNKNQPASDAGKNEQSEAGSAAESEESATDTGKNQQSAAGSAGESGHRVNQNKLNLERSLDSNASSSETSKSVDSFDSSEVRLNQNKLNLERSLDSNASSSETSKSVDSFDSSEVRLNQNELNLERSLDSNASSSETSKSSSEVLERSLDSNASSSETSKSSSEVRFVDESENSASDDDKVLWTAPHLFDIVFGKAANVTGACYTVKLGGKDYCLRRVEFKCPLEWCVSEYTISKQNDKLGCCRSVYIRKKNANDDDDDVNVIPMYPIQNDSRVGDAKFGKCNIFQFGAQYIIAPAFLCPSLAVLLYMLFEKPESSSSSCHCGCGHDISDIDKRWLEAEGREVRCYQENEHFSRWICFRAQFAHVISFAMYRILANTIAIYGAPPEKFRFCTKMPPMPISKLCRLADVFDSNGAEVAEVSNASNACLGWYAGHVEKFAEARIRKGVHLPRSLFLSFLADGWEDNEYIIKAKKIVWKNGKPQAQVLKKPIKERCDEYHGEDAYKVIENDTGCAALGLPGEKERKRKAGD
jgi:hypothetical protein